MINPKRVPKQNQRKPKPKPNKAPLDPLWASRLQEQQDDEWQVFLKLCLLIGDMASSLQKPPQGSFFLPKKESERDDYT
jgi:hypothetical protein